MTELQNPIYQLPEDEKIVDNISKANQWLVPVGHRRHLIR